MARFQTVRSRKANPTPTESPKNLLMPPKTNYFWQRCSRCGGTRPSPDLPSLAWPIGPPVMPYNLRTLADLLTFLQVPPATPGDTADWRSETYCGL